MADKRLRAGLIGIGDFAPDLAPYICEVMDLVAISSRSEANRARFAKRTGLEVPGFEHYEHMMDEVKMDAVFITSPNFVHMEQTVAAAERGIHVFCEKAMETNVPKCWKMVRACEKAGVRLMVGHKRRLRPPWARMIELKETLGEVRAITACGYFDSRPYNFPAWWRQREKSGGTLMLSGGHVIDWMLAMCGDVASVRAVAPTFGSDPSYDYPDTLHTTITFKSGATGSHNMSLFYPPLKFRQSEGPLVVCRQGGMRLLPDMDHIDLYWQHNDDEELHLERFDDLGSGHAFRKEVGDFARWITEGKQPCLTWREGLRCVEVMEAAHRSADQCGSVITLPLYTSPGDQ